MLSSGCLIEQVSKHIGHEDIQTTMKCYTRIIDAKRAPVIQKMNGLRRYVTMLKLINKNKKPRDFRDLLFKHLLFILATPFS